MERHGRLSFQEELEDLSAELLFRWYFGMQVDPLFATAQADGTARCSRSSGAPPETRSGERRRRRRRRRGAAVRRAAGRRRRSSAGTVATGPGAQSYGYLTPVVTINKGGTVSYTNGDAVKHNVSSPDGLFRSELADGGTDGAGGRGREAGARYVSRSCASRIRT